MNEHVSVSQSNSFDDSVNVMALDCGDDSSRTCCCLVDIVAVVVVVAVANPEKITTGDHY